MAAGRTRSAGSRGRARYSRARMLGAVLVATAVSVGTLVQAAGGPGHGEAAALTPPHVSAKAAALTTKRAAVLTRKKGIASSRYSKSDPAHLSSLNVSWGYNWGTSVPASSAKMQWVPMFWGSHSITADRLAAVRKGAAAGRYTDLLTFNEPDLAQQSNMTPEQAVALWPQLQSLGLRLVSPAVAGLGDGWLARFMTLAAQQHLRVDAIALHFYVDFTSPTAVASLKKTLETVYAQYKLPIWITELGAIDITRWGAHFKSTPDDAHAVDYLRGVTTMLNGLSFVQRYAWFTDDAWNNPGERTTSLFDGDGNLTSRGQAYRSVP